MPRKPLRGMASSDDPQLTHHTYTGYAAEVQSTSPFQCEPIPKQYFAP